MVRIRLPVVYIRLMYRYEDWVGRRAALWKSGVGRGMDDCDRFTVHWQNRFTNLLTKSSFVSDALLIKKFPLFMLSSIKRSSNN